MSRVLIKYSAISFAIQAATWTIMSFITIIVIESELYPETITTYSDFLSNTIYARFFWKDVDINEYLQYSSKIKTDYYPNYVLESEVFEAFAIFQLILNVVWFVFSILIYNWVSKKLYKSIRISIIRTWLAIGIAVAVIDFILTVVLLVDLSESLDKFQKIEDALSKIFLSIEITATGVVMTIVARGFLLFIINIVLLCIFCRKLWYFTTQNTNWLYPNTTVSYIGNTQVAHTNQMNPSSGQYAYPMASQHPTSQYNTGVQYSNQ